MLPNDRLLWWTAVLLPVALLSGLVPEWAGLLPVAALVLACLASIDAMLGARVLEQVTLETPETLRFTRDKDGEIPVVVSHTHPLRHPLALTLGIPESFAADADVLHFTLPQSGTRARAHLGVTPAERGRFNLLQAALQTSSPLGFWLHRRRLALKTELRVYPNLLTEGGPRTAHLLIQRNWGASPYRVVGQGREFEKLREYQPGDSYSDIHWKATAKRHRPITKLFQVERTQEVVAVVDTSRLSAMQPHPGEPRLLERYLSSALILAQAARRQGDRFGAVLFRDRVTRFIPPGGGLSHYDACRDAIYAETSADVSPDYRELCVFLRTRLNRRSLLVILTSLSDPVLAAQFVEGVRLVSRRHLVLVLNVARPHTEPLFSRPVETVDGMYEGLAGHHVWVRQRGLQRTLRRENVELVDCHAPDLAADVVSRYMQIKARQQL